MRHNPISGAIMASLALSVLLGSHALAQAAQTDQREWTRPGQGGVFPAEAMFNNVDGKNGIFNVKGPVDMKGHPFFEALGTNGRACVTCHQPSDAMGLSLASIRQQWQTNGSKDPLFAPVDGANCPNLPRD